MHHHMLQSHPSLATNRFTKMQKRRCTCLIADTNRSTFVPCSPHRLHFYQPFSASPCSLHVSLHDTTFIFFAMHLRLYIFDVKIFDVKKKVYLKWWYASETCGEQGARRTLSAKTDGGSVTLSMKKPYTSL